MFVIFYVPKRLIYKVINSIFCFVFSDFRFPRNLNELKKLAKLLTDYQQQNPLYVFLLFCSAYLYKQTFAIPGSVFMVRCHVNSLLISTLLLKWDSLVSLWVQLILNKLWMISLSICRTYLLVPYSASNWAYLVCVSWQQLVLRAASQYQNILVDQYWSIIFLNDFNSYKIRSVETKVLHLEVTLIIVIVNLVLVLYCLVSINKT